MNKFAKWTFLFSMVLLSAVFPHLGYSQISVAFSPDGRIIASLNGSGIIKLWDVETGRELRTLTGFLDGVSLCRYSPDGRSIVTVAQDGAIKLWDVGTGRVIRTMQ
ncbi:MAG: hypothetical protein LBI14_12070 [Treponema sp.]|jgi:WD40 repeat protein|nr:hypothetical protein [Treponema sp.]